MLETIKKDEMRKEGFGGGDEGLYHGTRQNIFMESRSDTTNMNKEIETDVEIERKKVGRGYSDCLDISLKQERKSLQRGV